MMNIGIVGTKQGMTRLFTEEGTSIPVTVVSVFPNIITQIKTDSSDGYNSVQVTFGSKKEKHLTKPELGHFNKFKTPPGEGLWELQIESKNLENLTPGSEIGLDQFEIGQKIDITGTSKGKGFAGTVKRWNFQMQDATHGNSLSHRAPGSIGQCQTPGRVWKGKKMSGHMGFQRKTIQNLEVMGVDIEKNILLVKGSVPGSNGSHVVVKPAIK
jgi:large subunit ribosomal protein L3